MSVSGRIKDVIIRKGENIAPAEVEDVLRLHPRVGDVVVVGLPDVAVGERCCAVVVARGDGGPTLEDLIVHCRAQGLAVYKIPERLVIAHDLPRNSSGKVLKRDVTESVLALAEE
jgi:acyl-CoA synthetase (AMP-forming)/AMP-acid ligase II